MEVEPGKKNRFHVAWLSDRFGVKPVFMVNTKIWIVPTRRIGSNFGSPSHQRASPSLSPYRLTKVMPWRFTPNARRSGLRPRGSAG